MWRALAVAAIVAALVAACHRKPAPTFEYGETVTYTSTAGDPAPQAVPPARAGSTAPSPESAAAPTEPAPAVEPENGGMVPESDAGWTTTVHTGAEPEPEPSEPAAAAPSEAAPPAASEPAAPPAPRQWYRAKPW